LSGLKKGVTSDHFYTALFEVFLARGSGGSWYQKLSSCSRDRISSKTKQKNENDDEVEIKGGSYLDPVFGEVCLERQQFPRIDIWVVGRLERLLQFLQLVAGEDCPAVGPRRNNDIAPTRDKQTDSLQGIGANTQMIS